MKKNITINLLGSLYAIDEDAYELLKRYMDSMRNYFRTMKGGEEIADDIEHRVAELLWQKKESGTEAINIETIKEIIEKIGKPDEINDTADDGNSAADMDSVDDENAVEADGKKSSDIFTYLRNMLERMKGRYLYRDPNDKIIGGVCSGVARFTESGTPLAWRLAIIALVFLPMFIGNSLFPTITFFTLIVYAVLWALVPMPTAPEDWLRMKGQDVNHENITNEIIKEADSESAGTEPQGGRRNGGCLSLLLKGMLLILVLPFIAVVGLCIMAVLFISTIFMGAVGSVFPVLTEDGHEWMIEGFEAAPAINVMIIISALLLIGIPIYCIYRQLKGSGRSITGSGVLVAVIMWIASLAVFIFSCISLAMNMERAEHRFHEEIRDMRSSMDEMQQMRNDRNVPPQYGDSTAVDTVGYNEH